MKEKWDLKKILREAKLKNTPSRLATLKLLSKIRYPATAEILHKKLKGVDLVTLYRTIASFEKCGILRKVDLRKDSICYELNVDHHHHMICTQCYTIEDFENGEVEKVLKQIATKSSKFKKINDHSLELFGLCKTCS